MEFFAAILMVICVAGAVGLAFTYPQPRTVEQPVELCNKDCWHCDLFNCTWTPTKGRR